MSLDADFTAVTLMFLCIITPLIGFITLITGIVYWRKDRKVAKKYLIFSFLLLLVGLGGCGTLLNALKH